MKNLLAIFTLSFLLASCQQHEYVIKDYTSPYTPASSQSSSADPVIVNESQYSSVKPEGSIIKNLDDEPISFATKGISVDIRKKHQTTLDADIVGLINASAACSDTPHNNDYYKKVADLLLKAGETIYSITSSEIPEATMYLMVVPNTPAYQDTAAFKDDLRGCGVGGAFPLISNKKWLVFEQTDCAGGAAATEKDAERNDFCITHFDNELIPSVSIK